MTEERQAGITDGKPDGTITIGDVIDLTLETLRTKLPNLQAIVLLDLARNAFMQLRDHLEAGTEGWSWKNPWARLEYAVAPDGNALAARIDERLGEDAALELARDLFAKMPTFVEGPVMFELTRGVIVTHDRPAPDGRQRCRLSLPPDLDAAMRALAETDRAAKLAELADGFFVPPITITGARDTPAGSQAWTVATFFAIRPLTVDRKDGRVFFPLQVGLDFQDGDPADWTNDERAALVRAILAAVDKAAAPFLPADWKRPQTSLPARVRAGRFAVAGNYVYPMFRLGMSTDRADHLLCREWHAAQSPLNWAVSLALFSLTDPDRIRNGEMQEASLKDLCDRVFTLTERGAPLRGDHPTDVLAEIAKLHLVPNIYYTVRAVKRGQVWEKRVEIGSHHPLPSIALVYRERQTGRIVTTTDRALRELVIPLEVKSRRATKPAGRDILALPADAWELIGIKWNWLQAFNDDLLRAPDLIEDGARKGQPKKRSRGKALRKGYFLPVTQGIFAACQKLRAEGPHSYYAWRLLTMLVSDLARLETGRAASLVFRTIGITEDFARKTHDRPEDIVAAAVRRLKAPDIAALLPGSDERPRTDRNPDRRREPYYRFLRAPEFSPRFGITQNRAEAVAIATEHPDGEEPPAPKTETPDLPGLETEPLPTGAEIRAAREAAGLTLRHFARVIGRGSFNTWARYERGDQTRPWTVPADAWTKVRAFVAKHRPPAGGGA